MSLLPHFRLCSAIKRLTRVPCRTCYMDLTYSRGGAYEGDGKTSLTVLNRDVDHMLLIDSYSTHGFRLNSGLFVCGPAAFFPRTLMHWDVAGPWDVTPASLSLFWLLEPKPDVLVIGVGDRGRTIDDEVRIFMKKKKINVEVLDTAAACAAFNFMNADNRNVAAAMIPNQTMRLYLSTELWDNAMIKGKVLATSGSSIHDMIDERERRYSRDVENDTDLIVENKYEPYNRMLAYDLREMLQKRMITEAEIKEKYPHMNIEAVKQGAYESPALLEAFYKRAFPHPEDKQQADAQNETKTSEKGDKH